MPRARALFWAATLGGVIVSIRSILSGPPPLTVAAILASTYVAFFLAGVFILRLQIFADAIVRGPEEAKGVVLTFDDGPHPEHTAKVLDVLEARSAHATFFVIGKKAEAHPELVREIVRRGHQIGVHGYAHDRLFALRGSTRVRKDLEKSIRTLEAITGTRPTLFRPPIGHTNPAIARIAEQLDLVVVGWSVKARDGISGATAAEVVARVTPGLEDGAIVLLHDAAERDDRTPVAAAALPGILDAIAARGLEVAELSAWLTLAEA